MQIPAIALPRVRSVMKSYLPQVEDWKVLDPLEVSVSYEPRIIISRVARLLWCYAECERSSFDAVLSTYLSVLSF